MDKNRTDDIKVNYDSLIPHQTQDPTQADKQDLGKAAASRLRPRLDVPSKDGPPGMYASQL